MLDPKFKNLLQLKVTRKEFIRLGAITVASLVGVVGVISEIASHAASPYGSQEAEDGSLAGGAGTINSSGASGGEAVVFGAMSMAAPILPGAPTHESLPARVVLGNFPNGGGPNGYVFTNSNRYMNIFAYGAAVSLNLTSSLATNWTCRDIYGNTSSGSVSGTTLTPTPPAGGTA
jgi:hypothetical protein